MVEIKTRLISRQWMRAAKAWRCFLELPDEQKIAVQLTGYIGDQFSVTIITETETCDIDPAYIVDIPNKGKRFHLVLETVFENQASIGPTLTAMVGSTATLIINHKIGDQGGMDTPLPHFPEDNERGDLIENAALRGLHATFFKNERFQAFITSKTGQSIHDESTCKEVFKEYMAVKSCKDLTQKQYLEVLHEFNEWIKKR
ncbi:hypothetical protein [Oryzomonas rubra]|uniref:Uncharacterized protein n=1 Tax=Oryzomonas rubra TaxID=2509454 RepID=A0A5A9X6W4_9BACT|nr:hypothetical protein [Oryzomonas rubra]KAA0888700.1 hypothetical protein ET418_15075 [Oryzomonas rubra]